MIEETVDKEKVEKIDKIEIEYLKVKDFESLKAIMIAVYPSIPDPYWKKADLQKLVRIFPEGQVVVKVNGEIAGCALSIIVDYDKFSDHHTYLQITGNESFSTHTPKGNVLYGIDIFIAHEFRGMRIGRRLYDYRKELCENMNLERIIFGGRLPNYHKYADKMTPKEYIENVRTREINDPVLDFQLNNDFHVKRVITNYLEGDKASKEYAALLEWDNIYYQKPQKKPIATKTVVRLGLVQWQMRTYKNFDELIEQAEYFIDTISGYRSDFALFPEFFNAPLMAAYNHLSEADAIRELAKYTEQIRDKFSELSISYNINIITGSMPYLENGSLYNVGFLCKRDGSVEKFYKLHVTPDEAKVWGMNGGDVLKTFNTDCGKIGILICYDVEFPELSRLLADQGMDILFVPFLTDTQNGYSRVRHCAQARAVENECYVAIAGSVGNIPKVHNMDMQFAQSMVLTPCDFQFPTNGVKAEATPNAEMILVADVDVDLLKELNQFGSVHNLNDRRKDLFSLKLKKK
ncbi:bifunctional GNAT family N-acetyltransferase/carbon-nitrogen hydrolase family protein [Flavimarina sp. Hel_I_48]|uniref:bifunctional GNAT family N-acetyltransferase/carbon-nitrogen hydrolase family protein n=1 Tax=Flavimarina sp. Hel_I_48 TaxID=1392488 RepID=UPI0004DF1BC1|nr:bifunctional GNAT family N-acetyltransferase/carbon-nitrogen hydrolase family protein [Flavimarina sp. Hel_I_48]